MFEHAEVLNVLLSHCKGLLDEQAVDNNDGFQVYVLEFPGLDFIVEAKRTSKIGYTYIIRAYDRRFKVYTISPRVEQSEAMSSLIPKAPAIPKTSSTLTKAKQKPPIPRSSVVMSAVRTQKKKKA